MSKKKFLKGNTMFYDEAETIIFALEDEILRLFNERGCGGLLMKLDEELVTLKHELICRE